MRSETFADHYSQARQFYISQTPTEQMHISDAIIFELSKVQKPVIRERIVGHLENIDKELAQRVADGLGFQSMPPAAKAARETKMDLPPSPELSILKNGPTTFKDRKLGILVTDGANAEVLAGLKSAAASEGADVAIIAPTVGGVTLSDGTHILADEKIDGGPSVLYDAVAIDVSQEGAKKLSTDAATKGFISDAFAYLKYIGYNDAAAELLTKAGVDPGSDEGIIKLTKSSDGTDFITACRKLRIWSRVDKTKMAEK